MLDICTLLAQITFKNFKYLHAITPITRKKLKDIHYALLRLITVNYTQSKFPFTKLNFSHQYMTIHTSIERYAVFEKGY